MSAPAAFIYDPPVEPWLEVLHRDEDLLVVNKPSGLLSVPGKAATRQGCAPSLVGTSTDDGL